MNHQNSLSGVYQPSMLTHYSIASANKYHKQAKQGLWPLTQLLLWFGLFIMAATLEQKAWAGEQNENSGQYGDSKAGLYFGLGEQQQAIHLHSEADVLIQAMAATTTLKQRFKNTSDQAFNGEYILPLAEDAAISAMTIRIGERTIKARIKTKPEARKMYQQAQRQGKKAALLEQDRGNLFRQKIANIGAGETIEIEIQWQQKVEYLNGSFSWRLPMTLTPRYQPQFVKELNNSGEPENIETTHSVQTAKDIAANSFQGLPQVHNDGWTNQLKLNIKLDAGFALRNIQSLFNPVQVQLAESGESNNGQRLYLVQPKQGSIAMDRDFVLQWQAEQQEHIQFAGFLQAHEQHDYFTGMLTPQITPIPASFINRNSIFIIDISGSMAGTSIEQAKAALSLAIKQLDTQDSFNIIAFNHQSNALFSQSVAATDQNKQQALDYIKQLKADGGTEMLPALEMADSVSQDSNHEFLTQVFFITDGSISDEQRLLQTLYDRFSKKRIFTIAIGSAPNHFFMRKAAQFGRGSNLVINDLNQVYKAMQELFQQLQTPQLTNIQLALLDSNNKPLESESYPQNLPDLYLGQPLLFSSQLPAGSQLHTARITALYAGQPVVFEQKISTGESNLALSQIWARAKIESLSDLKYQARGDQKAEDALKQEITQTALKHQLVSAYTSLIAVEEFPENYNFAKQTAAIPNLKPQGQSISLPQTATLKSFYYFAALAMLLLAISAQGLGIKTEAESSASNKGE